MTDPKSRSIDNLVSSRRAKQAELLKLGEDIANSSSPVTVLFIDLADSTQLKHDRAPEEWLGYVFDFLQRVAELASAAGLSVVKRIGDELLLTAPSVATAEQFIDTLATDAEMMVYTYKVAADTGAAYHFQFADNLPDDPYGPVVDRCARVAKLVGPGAILTTAAYVAALPNAADYVHAGKFTLKGIPGPVDLYFRPLALATSDEYLAPLIEATNRGGELLAGYRFVARMLTPTAVTQTFPGEARPYRARELLNVPRLPYSLQQFDDVVNSSSSSYDRSREYLGYFVEWLGRFEKLSNSTDALEMTLIPEPQTRIYRLKVVLPRSYMEIVNVIKPGELLRVRGIITDMLLSITLNYADFDVVMTTGA